MPRCAHGFERGLGLCPECREAPEARPRVPSSEPRRRGDVTRFSHPGFQDMAGETLAGAAVLRRAPNVDGNACWLVRAACGHELVIQGIALRAAHKRGGTLQCIWCRPKRPGTVMRRRGARG